MSRIAKGAITDDIWQANTTDDSWVTKGWKNNAISSMSHSGKVDMWEYKDRKRGNRLSQKDLDKIDTTDSSYYSYIDDKNEVRIIMLYKDDKGNTKYAEVGDKVVGATGLADQKTYVKQALTSGNNNVVQYYMHNINNLIYGEGNTRALTQGKTSDKLSSEGSMDDDYINALIELE